VRIGVPNRLRGLGSVVSSPSGVRGGAPAANAFSGIFEAHRTLLVERTMLLRSNKASFSRKIHSIDDWGHVPCLPSGYASILFASLLMLLDLSNVTIVDIYCGNFLLNTATNVIKIIYSFTRYSSNIINSRVGCKQVFT